MYLSPASAQSEADEYTRYELLGPQTASFRIYYEVTTTAGAGLFYNPIRKGSAASDESVYDATSGAPLHFEIVTGSEARKDPLVPDADPETRYIKVTLARPVPDRGQGRLVILKTYRDEKTYRARELPARRGGARVRSQPRAGAQRRGVAGRLVLYLSAAPALVTQLPDGRVRLDYWDDRAEAVGVLLKARRRVGAQR